MFAWEFSFAVVSQAHYVTQETIEILAKVFG